MFWIKQTLWESLIRQTANPKQAQEALLLRILANNKNTAFGIAHSFSTIKGYADFCQAVPVQTYEALRGYIERLEVGEIDCLNARQLVMYAQTSGTTGKPKYIPLFAETITQYRRSQYCAAYAIYAAIPRAYAGKVLAIVSPAIEGYLPSGTAVGSMSGLIYRSMPDLILSQYILPPSLFEITDYELKYHLMAVLALSERNITLIATANPSTLLRIIEIINTHLDQLISEIALGNSYGLRANPQRADELRNLAREKHTITFADIWPNLQAVSTWTGGNCRLLIPALKKQLQPATSRGNGIPK